jgi:hypothetical protein
MQLAYPPRKGQRASSPSSLIGLPDHSGMFPAVRSHCASSRHPESRRSGCAADSGQLSARQLPCPVSSTCQAFERGYRPPVRGCAGSRCNGIHFKGTTASGVFLPDTTQPAFVRWHGFIRKYGLLQPSETKTVISSSKGAVSAGFHIHDFSALYPNNSCGLCASAG